MRIKKDVSDYFKRYPDIKKIALLAYREAKKEFKNSCVSLEMYYDPEIVWHYPIICIRQKKYEGLMSKIRKFRIQFHIKLSKAKGFLLITTDYGRPK